MVSWTLFGFLCFMNTGIYIALFVMFAQMFWRYKYRYLLFFVIYIGLIAWWATAWGISLVLESREVYVFAVIPLMIDITFAVALYDYINGEKIGTWKMATAWAIGAMMGVLLADPATSIALTRMTDGSQIVGMTGSLAIVGYIGIYFGIILLTTIIFKIYRHSPASLKRYARLLVIGILAFIAMGFLAGIMPGYGFEMIGNTISGIMLLWAFLKAPQLGYVLPFKVARITVLSTVSGIPLFDHAWEKQGVAADDSLYAGMLQGVRMIFKESLNRGEVQEVRVQHGVVILRHNESREVAFVLLASAATKTLREALTRFASLFLARFNVSNFDAGVVDQFAGASEIVSECFAFVPE